jgi:membrane protease YdiL (CAAX protease family)
LWGPIMKRWRALVLVCIGVVPLYLNGLYNPQIAHSLRLFWTVEVITWIIIPACILVIGLRQELWTSSALGITARVRGRSSDLWLLLAFVISVPLLIWIDQHISDYVRANVPEASGPSVFHYRQVVPPPGTETGTQRILVVFFLCMTAGVVEELYYRGIFRTLFGSDLIQKVLFVLVSSLVFSGSHWEGGTQKLISTFLFGIIFASLYLVWQNLWPLMVAHFLIDVRWLIGT